MRIMGFWVLSVAALSAPAFAADVPATSKIEAVTVFPTGAEIVRSVSVKLDAGEHSVLLNDVTGQANAGSIRVENAAGEKLEIRSIDARRLELPDSDPAVTQSARKKIEDEIEKLRDQRGELDDVVRVAQEQNNYLKNLEREPTTQTAATQPTTLEDRQALFTMLGARMTELAKTARDAKLKQRDIDEQIKDLKKELSAVGGKSQDRTEIRIYVNAGSPLETTLKLHYQVSSASWTAFYDARLNTGDSGSARKLSITRFASIAQTTGEDWEDIALSLSTTRPGTATAAPELNMLTVDFDGASSGGAQKLAGESNVSPNKAQYVPVEKSAYKDEVGNYTKTRNLVLGKKETQVSGTALQAVYAMPGKATIKTTGEAKRLQIMAEEMEPELLVRTVPRLDHNAYLYAKFILPKTSSPLLGGQVALQRDGVVVGNGELPQLAPGEDMELGFGADERVKVKRVVSEDKKGETGTFTTSYMEERSYVIAVKNLHARPVQLQVIDRMPVPMHQDIKVEFTVTKGGEPTIKDVNDRRGTMLWQMSAAPDEEKSLAFGYRITGPKDKPLQYQVFSDDDQFFRFGASTKF
jgi:uncharacterized protein (TIGR02231 family)